MKSKQSPGRITASIDVAKKAKLPKKSAVQRNAQFIALIRSGMSRGTARVVSQCGNVWGYMIEESGAMDPSVGIEEAARRLVAIRQKYNARFYDKRRIERAASKTTAPAAAPIVGATVAPPDSMLERIARIESMVQYIYDQLA